MLLVGAHVGDMEFTAGHVARLHSAMGEKVTLLHLTAGEGGHPGRDRVAYRAQKLEEAEESASYLKAECRILDYEDGSLVPGPNVVEQVATAIRELAPAVLVTHWRGSLHEDHANCFFIVEKALARIRAEAKSSGQGNVPRVFYAENWEDADGFHPDVSVDISPAYDDWLRSARCHELFRGGVVAFDYQRYYQALSTLRGCLAGVAHAAALMAPPTVLPSPIPHLVAQERSRP